MTFRREKDLQARVRDKIKLMYGRSVWYYHPRTRVQQGVPDIILCFYGRFVMIELKKDLSKTNPSKLQQHNLDLAVMAGGEAFAAHDVEGVINELELIRKSQQRS